VFEEFADQPKGLFGRASRCRACKVRGPGEQKRGEEAASAGTEADVEAGTEAEAEESEGSTEEGEWRSGGGSGHRWREEEGASSDVFARGAKVQVAFHLQGDFKGVVADRKVHNPMSPL
jgi:hypothetical protein